MGCETQVPPGGMCNATHCGSYINTSKAKAYCDCINWKGDKIPDCTKKGPNEPTWTNECYNKVEKKGYVKSFDECLVLIQQEPNVWTWRDCACCCSCFAWFTKVATSDRHVRFIQDFEVGDTVYAASVSLSGEKLKLSWEDREVVFSDGTSPTQDGQEMILIQYGALGEPGELIATNDQMFLLPDGTLMRADRLKPGDQLVRDNGLPIKIISVFAGQYVGGIHHIATPLEEGELDEDKEFDINGHLISTNGVVTGDYWTQVRHLSNPISTLLAKGHEDMPVFGSEAYTRQKGINATLFSASLEGEEPRPIGNRFFMAREEPEGDAGVRVPADARRYFTPGQMKNIKKAPHAPVTSQKNIANFRYLKQLFEGFFPSINLYLQWEDEDPNLYAFTQYGQKTVYISGRLLRTEPLEREGLAVILSFGVAMFLDSAKTVQPDSPCTGVADYFGLGYVLADVFNYNWSDVATKGYTQVKALFGKITGKNRDGDPDNLCLRPSIDCRQECLSAALSGFNVPSCAEGPEPGQLRLEAAKTLITEGMPTVIAAFNDEVEFVSASKISNYSIHPVVEITTALRDPIDHAKVNLTVDFPDPPDGEYTLTVSDILSADGSTLNPEARTATFTVKVPKTKTKKRK